MAPALLACVLLAAHADYLAAPSALWDEKIFLDATALLLDGVSPYAHHFYNYPPPLVELAALATAGGWSRELLLGLRTANLGGVIALAWLAATRTGWKRASCLLAAIAVGCSPVISQALRFGNLSPLLAAAGLAAIAIEWRRPWMAATLLGFSVAVKPLLLGAGAFLTGHRLLSGPRRPTPIAALVWPLVVVAMLAPGAELLPAMLARMSVAYYDPHHLSIKRILTGLGLEVPATLIAAAVIVSALVLFRRRPLRPDELVAVAPTVALLALPIVWAHSFALTLPLQLIAVARLEERFRRRRKQSPNLGDLLAAVLVFGSIGLIQGSASALLVNDWTSSGIQLLACLLPTLAPAALVAFVRSSAAPIQGEESARRSESVAARSDLG